MPARSAPGPTGSPENCRAAADAILLAAAKTGMGLRDLAGLAPVILSFRVSHAGHYREAHPPVRPGAVQPPSGRDQIEATALRRPGRFDFYRIATYSRIGEI
jgi:hypothetical protein